jgi:hypothetical protein
LDRKLRNVVDHLYQVATAVPVSRLGLRYVNALKSDKHGIKGLQDPAIGFRSTSSHSTLLPSRPLSTVDF